MKIRIAEIFDTPEEILKAYAYDKLCENRINELTDEEFLALRKIIKSSVELKEIGNFIKNLADERNKDNQQMDELRREYQESKEQVESEQETQIQQDDNVRRQK